MQGIAVFVTFDLGLPRLGACGLEKNIKAKVSDEFKTVFPIQTTPSFSCKSAGFLLAIVSKSGLDE